MSKQLLIIEPAHELKFVGPFCTAVSSFMRLTNPTEHVILFKIKTTAPKKYCVRPNCGILEPKDTIEITIVLQPFIFEAAEKNKHKFMVQSMIMPEGDVHIDSVWKDCNPANLMDSKLRCVFELPEEKEMTLSEMAELGGANKREATGVVEIKERQTAKVLKDVIINLIKSYDIQLIQIISITSDNGSNMVAAGREIQHGYISENLDDEELDPAFMDELVTELKNATTTTVSCAVHTQQLAVVDVTKHYDAEIRFVTKAAKNSRKIQYQAEFERRKMSLPPLYAKTRWEGVFCVMQHFSQNRQNYEELGVLYSELDPAVPDDTPKKNVSGVGGFNASELQSSAEKDKSSGGVGGSAEVSDARKLLEETATNLRHENLILKESLLRLQLEKENLSKEMAVQSSSATSSSSGAVPEYANVYRPPALAQQQQIPIVYVAAAIALAIFGFILGKFVL